MKQSEQLEDFVEPFDDAAAKQDEGLHVEKKSSIVFDQATSKPDLNNQLGFNIMKEIAAFANTEGGYLYIGIRNDGEVVGVEKDYTHLNEGVSGLPPRYRYHADWDHYRLIILDVASKRLQSDIDRLIRITKMPTSSGKTVCRVYVKPCRDNKPIFYHFLGQQRLFVRSDGKVVERTAEAWEREIENWPNRLNALPPPETDSENGFYFSILDDGTISLREKKRNGQGIRYRVPVPARKHIKGWLLFVYNDGTLRFVDPNRILSQIQKNGGFSDVRIVNSDRIIGAFHYQHKSYVFVSTVWQEALDGFKCFNPETLFESGIEPDCAKRFLGEGDVEIRNCYLISNEDEVQKFWCQHPFWETDTLKRVTSLSGKFHPAKKECYGSLIHEVGFRFYNDLLHLAMTGTLPTTQFKSSPKSFFLRAFCKGDKVIGFKVEHKRPTVQCMTADDNISAKLFCTEHYDERAPFPPYIEIMRESQKDYDSEDRMVFLFGSGVPVMTGVLSIFPGFSNEGKVFSLAVPDTLRGFFFTNLNDFLVLAEHDINSNSQNSGSAQFYFIPVREIPLYPYAVEDPAQVQQLISCPNLKAFTEWGLNIRNLVAAGILRSKPGNTESNCLSAWLSSSEWFMTPQCPIKYFDPHVWIHIRQYIRNAKICSFKSGMVVESPIEYDDSQSQRIIASTDPNGGLTDFKRFVVPKSKLNEWSNDQLNELKEKAKKEGGIFEIADDDEVLRTMGFQPFMIEKEG